MRKLLLILLMSSPVLASRGPSDPLPAGFQVFPTNNVWNTRCDNMPLSSSNTYWIDVINGHAGHNLHMDFGTTYQGRWNGIPYSIVNANTQKATTTWNASNFASESDPIPVGGLPFPTDGLCESDTPTISVPLDPASDRHCILIDTDSRKAYETFGSSRVYSGGVWQGSWSITQLTIWDLQSNNLRTAGWTSADAAGLPILPGLIRYDEVQAGAINHALRFTLSLTHGPYLWPARHDADSGGTNNPPFGMRVRLKASFDISGYSATNQIILTALKRYGMFMADNGEDWFISGAPNASWNDSDLSNLAAIVPLTTFEVVDETGWIVDPNSAQARAPSPATTMGGSGYLRGSGVLR